jgi:amidophosphoribosyltransferase
MCGLIGVVGTPDSAYEVFLGLMNLQHRGQDGAGLLTIDSNSLEFALQKGNGLVENVFSERTFRQLKGITSIGHTRYATIGRRDPNMLQPFLDNQAGIGIAHNGNIVNCYQLREELHSRNPDLTFQCESDSEVILKLLAEGLAGGDHGDANMFAAIGRTMDSLVGSYSIVGLCRDGSLFGFRDPDGIRPLILGSKTFEGKTIYGLASESVALDYNNFTVTEEIKPGEAVIVRPDGTVSRKMVRQNSYSPCMFEWVYFARVESEMGGHSVYEARFRLGTFLAEELKRRGIQADIVLPVPETSRIAGIALAEAMGLPFREVLIKNRYVNRTFILESQESRQAAIRRKLYPIASEFAGKRCIVVDDSIVRGNTAVQIVKLIRQAGAREVIMVSTCPPISSPCYYGIDFPSPDELIAVGKTEEEIAKEIGADKVIFQTVEGLQRALAQKNICTGCLTKKYPTDVSHGEDFQNKRVIDRMAQEIAKA